jgi:hypothetical protein
LKLPEKQLDSIKCVVFLRKVEHILAYLRRHFIIERTSRAGSIYEYKKTSSLLCMHEKRQFRERGKCKRQIEGGWVEVEERILIGHWNSKVVGGKGNKINY